MTATILEFPACPIDREFSRTGETAWTRALAQAEAIGAAIAARQLDGIAGRINRLEATVAGMTEDRADDAGTRVYFEPTRGMQIATTLSEAPAFLRSFAASMAEAIDHPRRARPILVA